MTVNMFPTSIPVSQLAVLWFKGGRIGSVNQSQLPALMESFSLSLIQRDGSGCEHWNILGRWRTHQASRRKLDKPTATGRINP